MPDETITEIVDRVLLGCLAKNLRPSADLVTAALCQSMFQAIAASEYDACAAVVEKVVRERLRATFGGGYGKPAN